MLWFNKINVYMGYSLKEFSKTREILAQQKIPYTYKIVDHSQEQTGRGTIRGNFGSFGTNKDYEKLYYVFVKKDDFEKAQYLIDGQIHI